MSYTFWVTTLDCALLDYPGGLSPPVITGPVISEKLIYAETLLSCNLENLQKSQQ